MYHFQVAELRIDLNDLSVCQAPEEPEEDDDVGNFEGIAEDTDEEYVCFPSTSTARMRKAQCKTGKTENGEAVEGDARKDSVQCPTCDKSFKSKYYLKVHNRYTSRAFPRDVAAESAATHVSLSQAAHGGEAVWLPEMWEEVLQEGESPDPRGQRLCQGAGE